jgi:hypothetical protein
MDNPRAFLLEAARYRRGIRAVHRRLIHRAAQQAHDLPALEIDRRNYGEGLENLRNP